MKIDKKIYAFVHIEKAAGITFTSILEENFTFKHCRVESLKKRFPVVFDAEDMMVVQRINPFVEAISGHPVRPFSDLGSIIREINYITLLREPVARYLSHYQYWVERMNNPLSFDDFLKDESVQNFQTKKIAGSDDIEIAKKYLDSFFLVGIVEDFDSFLTVLQKKMAPRNFGINYEKKNIGSSKIVNKILFNLDKYKDQIMDNNSLDMELYRYAKNLLEKEKKVNYPVINKKFNEKNKKKYLWKIFRNYYYTPVLKLFCAYYARKGSN